MKLDSASVLVTGAGGGIGSAIAAELASRGAAVMLAGRDATVLEATAASLDGPRERIATVVGDLATEAGRRRVCEAAARWRGGINVLVNNAGVSDFGLFEDQPVAAIDHAVAINLLAPLHLCHALLPTLQRHADAAVLNVGSAFGSIGYPGFATYSATKFALRGFSEALRRELAGTGVRVHHLAPRATRTAMNSTAVEQMNAELGVAMDTPQSVARAAREMLEQDTPEAVVGWPEKFFARLNAVLPRVVDRALLKQLPVIRRYAGESTPPPPAAGLAASPSRP
jgi:short-subunit dehydrogenase